MILTCLAEASRIEARIAEGEAKRSKRSNLEALLTAKIASVDHPMQELELNYPTTKGKVYSEEEDRYLLCRLNHYGMTADDVYERIKKDISEFPVFRFDWFIKSRSVQELQRRCNTLLGMIEKEGEGVKEEIKIVKTSAAARGKVRKPSSKLADKILTPQKQKRGLDDADKESTPAGSATGAKKKAKKTGAK